mgnify:CR=1 FL=1
MRYYRSKERNKNAEVESKEEETANSQATQIFIPQDSLLMYEQKKEQILCDYREFNKVKRADIADLAYILEVIGYPIHRIVDKLLRDLSGEISKAVILKAIPSKYITAATMDKAKQGYKSNTANIDSITLTTLCDASDVCKSMHRLIEHMINNLNNMPEVLNDLDNDKKIMEHIEKINTACKEIRAIIDDIKGSKDQDMRAYIRELQELCMHLLSLTYSYRHIAKIFGVSAKWASKIVKERSIENLPSVYITLDRDVKRGEQIDILPYALGLYKQHEA